MSGSYDYSPKWYHWILIIFAVYGMTLLEKIREEQDRAKERSEEILHRLRLVDDDVSMVKNEVMNQARRRLEEKVKELNGRVAAERPDED